MITATNGTTVVVAAGSTAGSVVPGVPGQSQAAQLSSVATAIVPNGNGGLAGGGGAGAGGGGGGGGGNGNGSGVKSQASSYGSSILGSSLSNSSTYAVTPIKGKLLQFVMRKIFHRNATEHRGSN